MLSSGFFSCSHAQALQIDKSNRIAIFSQQKLVRITAICNQCSYFYIITEQIDLYL